MGLKFGLALALAAVLATAAGAAGVRGDFDAYPAKPYAGPPHAPDFSGRSRPWLQFRTNIRRGFAHGDVFAGRYVIAGWGCGEACVTYVMGDLVTGRIIDFPISGETYPEARLEFRPTSRLLRAYWVANPVDDSACKTAELVWTGRAFIQGATRTLAGECPDPHPAGR